MKVKRKGVDDSAPPSALCGAPLVVHPDSPEPEETHTNALTSLQIMATALQTPSTHAS